GGGRVGGNGGYAPEPGRPRNARSRRQRGARDARRLAVVPLRGAERFVDFLERELVRDQPVEGELAPIPYEKVERLRDDRGVVHHDADDLAAPPHELRRLGPDPTGAD